jgi:surface antigen
LLIGASLAQPALGQVNPFRGSSATPLNADDIAALTEATNRLLDRPQLVTGATESWSNPKSGASGTITAGSAVQRKGMACRIVGYQNTVPGPRAKRNATLTWCKTKDGWKVA